MGLFDKPEYHKISEIPDGKPFYLIQINLKNVDTQYGVKQAFDLRISSDDTGSDAEWFGGFAAGILRQLQQIEEDELPTWAKFDTTEAKGGRSGTRILVPCEQSEIDEELPF